jgi:hypothetical protein
MTSQVSKHIYIYSIMHGNHKRVQFCRELTGIHFCTKVMGYGSTIDPLQRGLSLIRANGVGVKGNDYNKIIRVGFVCLTESHFRHAYAHVTLCDYSTVHVMVCK